MEKERQESIYLHFKPMWSVNKQPKYLYLTNLRTNQYVHKNHRNFLFRAFFRWDKRQCDNVFIRRFDNVWHRQVDESSEEQDSDSDDDSEHEEDQQQADSDDELQEAYDDSDNEECLELESFLKMLSPRAKEFLEEDKLRQYKWHIQLTMNGLFYQIHAIDQSPKLKQQLRLQGKKMNLMKTYNELMLEVVLKKLVLNALNSREIISTDYEELIVYRVDLHYIPRDRVNEMIRVFIEKIEENQQDISNKNPEASQINQPVDIEFDCGKGKRSKHPQKFNGKSFDQGLMEMLFHHNKLTENQHFQINQSSGIFTLIDHMCNPKDQGYQKFRTYQLRELKQIFAKFKYPYPSKQAIEQVRRYFE